jgi:hypothetical protein
MMPQKGGPISMAERSWSRLPLGWRFAAFIAATSISAILAGCGGGAGGSAPSVTSVKVSCSRGSTLQNQTSTWTATVTGTGDYSSSVTWSANSSTVGTASGGGVFTSIGAGTATIIATSAMDNAQGSAMVIVLAVYAATDLGVETAYGMNSGGKLWGRTGAITLFFTAGEAQAIWVRADGQEPDMRHTAADERANDREVYIHQSRWL